MKVRFFRIVRRRTGFYFALWSTALEDRLHLLVGYVRLFCTQTIYFGLAMGLVLLLIGVSRKCASCELSGVGQVLFCLSLIHI